MSDKIATGDESGVVVARVRDEISQVLACELESGLYVIATPIGNLADITIRALGALVRADVVYAEDTRHSRKLMTHYGITTRLRPYHEHNAIRERPNILALLSRGARVALVSDAGTPLISDPGYKLVRDVVAQGHKVFSLPGASASLAGLSCSGLPTDCFVFVGFLSSKAGERKARIASLADFSGSLIFFEAPSRVGDLLVDLRDGLGPRQAVVARELTKMHEEIMRGSLDDLCERVGDAPLKGECVVVVGPGVREEISDETIVGQLGASLKEMSLRDASRAVSDALDVPRGRVYELGLKIKRAGA